MDRVTVLFDDAVKTEFSMMDNEKMVPLSSDYFHDSNFPFFSAQRVQVKVQQSFIVESTTWFFGTEKHKEDEGTIYTVNA